MNLSGLPKWSYYDCSYLLCKDLSFIYYSSSSLPFFINWNSSLIISFDNSSYFIVSSFLLFYSVRSLFFLSDYYWFLEDCIMCKRALLLFWVFFFSWNSKSTEQSPSWYSKLTSRTLSGSSLKVILLDLEALMAWKSSPHDLKPLLMTTLSSS